MAAKLARRPTPFNRLHCSSFVPRPLQPLAILESQPSQSLPASLKADEVNRLEVKDSSPFARRRQAYPIAATSRYYGPH